MRWRNFIKTPLMNSYLSDGTLLNQHTYGAEFWADTRAFGLPLADQMQRSTRAYATHEPSNPTHESVK